MVIDASVAFKWLIEEPDSASAIGWIGREELIAPTLIHAEVGNALWKRLQRKELTAGPEASGHLASIASLVRTVEETPYLPRALAISVELGHPIYDCVYLALAEGQDEGLLTADTRFLRAVQGSIHAERVQGLHHV